MSYCRMAPEREELNTVEVQRKVGFAGSANIEHTRDLMFT